MSSLVIVITDLYPSAAEGADVATARPHGIGPLPGIGTVARYGTRTALPAGWRAWLADRLGRGELAAIAPARVALAAATATLPPIAAGDGGSCWVATPVHLQAGMTRVHLEHAGLLRLAPAQQQALALDFQRQFAAGGLGLTALRSGSFVLRADGIAPAPVEEPARWVGRDMAQALPQGREAGALRRLNTEIEMWLHAQPARHARQGEVGPAVNALWLWGALGAASEDNGRPVALARQAGETQVYGRDAVADGLVTLAGLADRDLPGHLRELPAPKRDDCVVLLVSLAQQLIGRIDENFVVPALAALRRGEVTTVTVMSGDSMRTLRRSGLLKFWRSARAAL